MNAELVTKGSVDRSVKLRCLDSTTGLPKSDVSYNSAGIDLWYRREGAAKTSITEATLASLTTAHTDGGFLLISDGDYRLDLPDAAFASGANHVDYGGTVTGGVFIGGRVTLIDINLNDAIRMGMTALPNAAASAAGGLLTRGTGAGQVNQDANGRIDVNVVAMSGDTGAADNMETAFDETAGPVPWLGIADQGTAQSATSTGIVLRSAAAFADSSLVGCVIAVFGSTQGYWQFREITANLLSGDAVTVDAWTVTPSGTITYKIFGAPAAPSTLPSVNVAQISGDSGAADNMEAFFDGTGYAGTNNTIPTVGTVNTLANNSVNAAALAADAGTEIATAVWANGTRVLTAGTNIALAKGTGVTGFNDLDAAGVRSAVGLASANADTQLAAIKTDTGNLITRIPSALFSGITSLAQWLGLIAGKQTGNSTARTELRATGAGSGTFDETTDSAEALRDRGDASWATATGFATASNLALSKAILDKLDTGLEVDGGVYRWTANALEQGPAGGGGGSSDWTADQKAAISAILGIPGSGTTPADPSTGILDVIRDAVLAVKAKSDNLPADPASASTIATSFGTVNSTLSTLGGYITTILGHVDTEIMAIKAKTDLLPGAPAATGDIPSAAAIVSAIFARAVEGSVTFEQSIRLQNSVAAGKATGLNTANPKFRSLADDKDRLSVTMDNDNRTAVVRDLT